MVKNYVLDTNVLLHDPNSLFSFQDNRLFIPLPVLEELDRFKTDRGQIGANCRETVRILDRYRRNGNILQGVKVGEEGFLKIEILDIQNASLPFSLKKDVKDNWILFYTKEIQKKNPSMKTILVTKDINLRIKAQTLEIEAQDYLKDKSDLTNFPGFYEIKNCKKAAKDLTERGFLQIKDIPHDNISFEGNRYFDFGDNIFGKYDPEKKEIKKIGININSKIFGISPLNREQIFALDALLDDKIQLVTLVGKAGTGKTLLSIAAGLQKVTEEKKYLKLTVTKPMVPMGKEIGFIPGSGEEKMRPWVQPIFDNLNFLFGRKGIKPEEYLTKKNLLEVEILTYIRGRTLPEQYIIIDEAQNLTPHEVKTIITRVGKETKIVLTGDPSQIDNPYLDEMSNGLMYVGARFYKESISAHITLSKGERSPLASRAAEIL